MTEINCPICNRINDDSSERCWYCQAVLHPEKVGGEGKQDWLDGFRADGSQIPPPENEPASADNGQAVEVPDWLARIRQREQLEQGEIAPSGQESGQDSMDWLRDISDEMSQKDEQPSETTTQGKNELPLGNDNSDEWLKKLESWHEEGKPKKNTASLIKPQIPVITPLDKPENIEPVEESKPVINIHSEPGWLKELQIEANTQGENPSGPEESTPQIPVNEEHPETTPSEEIHDIESPVKEEPVAEFSEGKTEEPAELPEEGIETNTAATQPSSEPDWLAEIQSVNPEKEFANQTASASEPEPVEKPPFNNRDLMNWINKDHELPAQEKAEEITPSKNEGGEIEPAALPPWLQALRPEKAAQSSTAGKSPSTKKDFKNPLSGIEGALQGDTLNQFYTRPQTYANTLKISAEQENQILRLQHIAGEARWETQDTAKSVTAKSSLLRIIFSLLMIGGIFFALLTSKPDLVPSTLYSQAVVQTYNTITTLDPQRPVVVAADFDGSFYGELRWSSEALLQQLMKQNVPIAYLSTTQVGTTLLQETLENLSSKQSDYVVAEKTVNLGYLAGGTVGLQALAQDPQTALPLTVNLKPAWADQPLNSVARISDFGAVIVITENADTARYWVEQVKPSLGNTPLLVVISAQSAPMLQPYYDSGQVNGYLSGLSSGSAFENLAGSMGSANRHYSTYQLALLVVAIAIFIGGLVSLVVQSPSNERSVKK